MLLTNLADIWEFLDDNDYLIKAMVTPKGGCIIHFPERKFKPKLERMSVSYLPAYNKKPPSIIIDTFDALSNHNTSKVPCPTYAMRSAIMGDIQITCARRQYNFNFIRWLGADFKPLTNSEFLKGLAPSPKAGDEDKEEKLLEVMRLIQSSSDFEEAEEAATEFEVTEGFEFLKNLVEN